MNNGAQSNCTLLYYYYEDVSLDTPAILWRICQVEYFSSRCGPDWQSAPASGVSTGVLEMEVRVTNYESL